MARHRQSRYIMNIVASFRMDEFKVFFRVSRTSVQALEDWICRVCVEEGVTGITDRDSSGGMPQIPLQNRILILLWYMASLDKYRSIADRFGVSESTACCAVRNLLYFISQYLLKKLVVWPSAEEQQEMKSLYLDFYKFPGVVGMIDGTHIAIRRPSERGLDYFNRKDFYSIVLQGVVREDLRFTHINVGWPGKCHDARIFCNSEMYEKGSALCRDGHLLGDSAYPLLPWLLTPFRDNGHLTSVQKKYNYKQSAIRSAVERGFGLLKGRLTRLQHIDQRDLKTIVTTIVAGWVIHNICIMNNDEL